MPQPWISTNLTPSAKSAASCNGIKNNTSDQEFISASQSIENKEPKSIIVRLNKWNDFSLGKNLFCLLWYCWRVTLTLANWDRIPKLENLSKFYPLHQPAWNQWGHLSDTPKLTILKLGNPLHLKNRLNTYMLLSSRKKKYGKYFSSFSSFLWKIFPKALAQGNIQGKLEKREKYDIFFEWLENTMFITHAQYIQEQKLDSHRQRQCQEITNEVIN